MERKELYAKIKELNLADKVKEKLGKNYTNVDSLSLNAFIRGYTKKAVKAEPKKCEKKVASTIEKKFKALVELLEERHILLKSEASKLLV